MGINGVSENVHTTRADEHGLRDLIAIQLCLAQVFPATSSSARIMDFGLNRHDLSHFNIIDAIGWTSAEQCGMRRPNTLTAVYSIRHWLGEWLPEAPRAP
jgi:hypothetical protein